MPGRSTLASEGEGRIAAPGTPDEPLARPPSRSERLAALLDTRWLRSFLALVPSWRGVLVLNYHRVGESAGQPWDRNLWSSAADAFEEHLEFLASHADVIGPEGVSRIVAARRGRSVLLTFDDGYRDNYEIAFPLLRRYGLTAAFFVVSGFLDRPAVAWWDEIAWMVRHAAVRVIPPGDWLPDDLPLEPGLPGADERVESAIAQLVARYKQLPAARTEAFMDHLAANTGSGRCDPALGADAWMTWDMAREMRAAGMAIGGHTVHHPILGALPPHAQEEEIGTCAARMRDELGEPMRWLAYPVGFRGSFTDDTRAIARRHGVELAFSFYGGYVRRSNWDPLDVRRVPVGPELSRQLLHATVRLPQLFARESRAKASGRTDR